MKMLWLKFLLWVLEKSYTSPNHQVAQLVLKTGGKYLKYPHQTIYYKDKNPLGIS